MRLEAGVLGVEREGGEEKGAEHPPPTYDHVRFQQFQMTFYFLSFNFSFNKLVTGLHYNIPQEQTIEMADTDSSCCSGLQKYV